MRNTMMTTIMIAGCLNTTLAAAESYPVGLSTIAIPDPDGVRPIEAHIIYPADTKKKGALIAENIALEGFNAVRDAPVADEAFPLVLMSHGLFGKWSNYGWLGRELAASGMIVALPTHPGTAWTNRDSLETAKLWERPRDLSRIISYLHTDPEWAASTFEQPIAAIGHSLGGYTVLAATGARFDRKRYNAYCKNHPGRADCRWYLRAGIADGPLAGKLEEPFSDERLDAVISLDLGFTQAFDPKSVAAVSTPTLVIGAGKYQPELPVDAESRHLAAMLPAATSVYHELEDISHFSFFPRCKPGATEILAAAGEGDEVICSDGGGRDRQTLHAHFVDLIKTFLSDAGFKTPTES